MSKIKKFFFRNDYELLKLTIFVSLAGIFFSSILATGHLADDAYNSQIRGSLMFSDTSLFDRTTAEIKGWFVGAGRIFVFNWIWNYSLFYFFTSTLAVKIIGLSILLVNFILFYFIIRNLTKSSATALIAILIFPLTIQYRLVHDPVLAYAFHIPFLFLLIQISLLFFIKNHDQPNKVFSFLSVIIFTCALSISELSYPLFVIYFLISYHKSGNIKNSLFRSSPYIVIGIIYILVMLYLRLFAIQTEANPNGTYPTSNFHLNDIPLFLHALFVQIMAGFPSIVWLKNISAGLIFSLRDIPSTLLLIMIIYQLKIFINSPKTIIKKELILIALFLIVIPAMVISLSGHQEELVTNGIGYSYLSVFIQYFGVSILAVIFFIKIRGKNNLFNFLVAPIIIILFVTNLGLNNKVVKQLGGTYKYPREIIELAHAKGLFDQVPDKSFLYRFMLVPSDYHWSYATIIGKKFHTCELAKIDQRAIDAGDNYLDCLHKDNKRLDYDLTSKDAWTLIYNIDRKYGREGRLILAKINSIKLDQEMNLVEINTMKIKYYDLKKNKIYNLDLDVNYNFLELKDERYHNFKDIKPFQFELK
ncbi:hypothetical protein OAP73_00355 [Methylophilaceae bacterium]|nr:hypothetical protein [Methylophilaceae bacterium]